jgi:hypothetical protein
VLVLAGGHTASHLVPGPLIFFEDLPRLPKYLFWKHLWTRLIFGPDRLPSAVLIFRCLL